MAAAPWQLKIHCYATRKATDNAPFADLSQHGQMRAFQPIDLPQMTSLLLTSLDSCRVHGGSRSLGNRRCVISGLAASLLELVWSPASTRQSIPVQRSRQINIRSSKLMQVGGSARTYRVPGDCTPLQTFNSYVLELAGLAAACRRALQ